MNRVSATGLKDIEADTIEAQEIIVGTNNTVVDETGLQVYHPYSLLLPLEPSGYWNVHDQLQGRLVYDTIQDFQMAQINTALGYTQAALTSIGTITTPSAIAAGGSALASSNALQGLLLKQDKIHTFSNPINLNETNTSNRILSLKYDSSLTTDASGNLKVANSSQWTTINSIPATNYSEIYFAANGATGKVGIGKTNPSVTLDVSGNINFSGTLSKNSVVFKESQWTTTNTTDLFYNTGSVGIGTTTPTYKLDVNGAINATALYVNGTAFTGSTSQWTTNTGYINYNNVQVYPSEVRISLPPISFDTWVKYKFLSGALTTDSSTYNRTLTTTGSYSLQDSKDSLTLATNQDATIPSADWSTFTDLTIAGWFKTSALADGDKLLDFSFTSQQEYAFVNTTTDLLAWYKFDSSSSLASDSSVNNNNLTVNGTGTTYSTTSPIRGSGCLSFATPYANGNYITIPTTVLRPSGTTRTAFTIAFWMRRTQAISGQYVSYFAIHNGTDLNNSIDFGRPPTDGNNLYLRYGVVNLTEFATTSSQTSLNVWQHFVLTFQKSGTVVNANVFVNNVKYSVYTTPTWMEIANNIQFNRWLDGTIGGIAKDLDDIRFYNRVLTDTEVSQLYNYTQTVNGSINIKKVNTNLSFQINNTEIYSTPSNNATWAHILWNLKNSTNTPFVRISTTSEGTETAYINTALTSGTYINKLGSISNTGTIYINDFRIVTIPLTSAIKYDLFNQFGSYKSLVDDANLTTQLATKQNALTAGTGITISNNIISIPWTTNGNNITFYSAINQGNVGIGVNSPNTYRLEVNGTFNASTIYESGALISGKYAAIGHNHNTSYLSLSGGSLSGNLAVSGNVNGNNFVLPTSGPSGVYWNGVTSALGRAANGGEYSSDATTGDVVLRSDNRVLIQSGSGSAGIKITGSSLQTGTLEAYGTINAYQSSGPSISVSGVLRITNNGSNTNYWEVVAGSLDSGTYPNVGNLNFSAAGFTVGYVEDDLGASYKMNFTGQHRTISSDKSLYDDMYIGYIVSTTSKYKAINGKYKTNYTKENINVNDALPIVALTNKAYDKSVFGIISERVEDESHYYSSGNFISVFPKDGGDERLIVNGCGEGSIWVSNYNGNLENGDYIVSSPIPGIGMKQDSEQLCNYTVAKITMNCDFNPQLIPIEIIKQEIVIDESGNEISKNVLDENGNPIYENKLDSSGNIIYDYEYEMKTVIHNDVEYKMAFVGSVYKCS